MSKGRRYHANPPEIGADCDHDVVLERLRPFSFCSRSWPQSLNVPQVEVHCPPLNISHANRYTAFMGIVFLPPAGPTSHKGRNVPKRPEHTGIEIPEALCQERFFVTLGQPWNSSQLR